MPCVPCRAPGGRSRRGGLLGPSSRRSRPASSRNSSRESSCGCTGIGGDDERLRVVGGDLLERLRIVEGAGCGKRRDGDRRDETADDRQDDEAANGLRCPSRRLRGRSGDGGPLSRHTGGRRRSPGAGTRTGTTSETRRVVLGGVVRGRVDLFSQYVLRRLCAGALTRRHSVSGHDMRASPRERRAVEAIRAGSDWRASRLSGLFEATRT